MNGGAACLSTIEFLLEMETDRLAFAIGVGREVDGVRLPGRLLEFGDELLLALDDDVSGLEAVLDIYREIALGKVFDVPERGLNDVVLAQVLTDRFRLRRGLDDDQRG